MRARAPTRLLTLPALSLPRARVRALAPRACADAGSVSTAGGEQDKQAAEEEVGKISSEEASGPLGLADYVTIQHVDGGLRAARRETRRRGPRRRRVGQAAAARARARRRHAARDVGSFPSLS